MIGEKAEDGADVEVKNCFGLTTDGKLCAGGEGKTFDAMQCTESVMKKSAALLGDAFVTTYDVRLMRPNREPVIDVAAMHSLEHIIATFLRNDPDWKDEIIYWGPMGCLTGFYLILKGNRSPREIYGLLLSAFRSVADAQTVPGATAKNCGHYLMHNLGMAKWYAARFADYLAANAENPEIFEYPKTERLLTDDGRQFYDS